MPAIGWERYNRPSPPVVRYTAKTETESFSSSHARLMLLPRGRQFCGYAIVKVTRVLREEQVKAMGYQVLARKYRPQRFADVAGQDHVTRTLLNALIQGRIAHAMVTATQSVGDVHDTCVSPAPKFAPAGSGIASTDQLLPSQRSANSSATPPA